MSQPRPHEARIDTSHNVLVVLSACDDEALIGTFCGAVISAGDLCADPARVAGKTVYLCGDLSEADALRPVLSEAAAVLAVTSEATDWPSVHPGRVPLLVHGVGVLCRRFFDADADYFGRICAEHAFQSLTESTKPGTAHRTGIYLTEVSEAEDGRHFRLLRCSTNLSGPTENFRATDRHIVDALNQEAGRVFTGHAPLNHVLAQVYHNTPATDDQKQTKARIKAHADKTKDMPESGIMAFCTFYDGLDVLEPMPGDAYDRGYKKASGLTRLCFRLKPSVAAQPGCDLPERFTVTLYPGSVFFMPLSTNRWYTHEIRPSTLDARQLPTRMGYVVRCSSAEAVHRDGQTFLKRPGGEQPLEPPTPAGMSALRQLYAEENRHSAFVDYADRFRFSMNRGDYSAPDYRPADEFRQYALPLADNPYAALLESVPWEDVTQGRQGMVLVRPDPARGTPIVRTTTAYETPAICFRPIHERLARLIRHAASLPHTLNNVLIEHYTNAYAKMGFHSDQALDLEAGSSIAVFSCYRHPERATPPRMLVVEPKASGGERFEIPLAHNSVVVFSTDTNRRFRHKIVLDRAADPPENAWLGLTLRTSRTFVQHRGGQATFADGTPLVLADEAQRRGFYRLRGQENRAPDFAYPALDCTISPSDLLPPRPF